jgi:hypothetical protein
VFNHVTDNERVALDLLESAVSDAKASSYVWAWIPQAERLIYNARERVCVEYPSYMGNSHQWLSARCPLCKELVPLGQGERVGISEGWAHQACTLRAAAKAKEVKP